MLFIAGCEDKQPVAQHNLVGSIYTGVIPCADCEGIDYRLMLKNDNRYEVSTMYIGKTNRRFTERGRWMLKGDSLLILEMENAQPRRFKINNSGLVMLDQEGQEIHGSLAQMYGLNEANTNATDRRWQERRQRGIDFRAAANEPSWSLDIDFDKTIFFKTLNGDSITTPVPQMQRDTTSRARYWQTEVDSGSLRVKLYPTGCVDDMSGEVFDYFVRITYADKIYSGCGNFINETYKLNDFWQLHTLDGSEIEDSGELRQVPSLQFDVASEKVYGNTSCNQLNGTIALKDSSLAFSELVNTKMACPGNLEFQFLDALQQVDWYAILNAELLLMSQDDTLMTFRRAE